MNIEWREPITDRTQADIDHLRTLQQIGWQHMTQAQREEFKQDMKGALNRGDLERIASNIQIMLDKLNILHLDKQTPSTNLYPGSTLLPRTYQPVSNEYEVPEIPTQSYYYTLENVLWIIRTCRYAEDTPWVPEHDWNTYDKWNDIETIIGTAYERYNIQYYMYSGTELYAGEEPLL